MELASTLALEARRVTAITIQLDDEMADLLRRLAIAQKRSETEIVREALVAFIQKPRPLPKGIGQYHSGQANVSEQARSLLRHGGSSEEDRQ